MAKLLVFQFGDHEIPFALEKIERSRLYGYKEVEVLDEHGRRCELATLADDGRTVVGRGGIAMGYLSVEGQWCDRSQLTAVDLDGKPMAPIPSSFGAPIKLFDTVDVGVYLSHDIRLVYQLRPEGDASGLAAELSRGTIFSFPYSYRGGLVADAGFLLQSNDGHMFLAVGTPTKAELIGLPQSIALVDEEEEPDETDLMDFDMI